MVALSVRNLSIVDWEARAVLGVAAVAVLASSWLVFRRRFARWCARVAVVPLLVAGIGLTINAHYGYFPTLGTLLGRTAADQISRSTLRHLREAFVPHLRGSGDAAGARPAASVPLPSHGAVIAFSMPGTTSHFDARTGEVYLPPIWFSYPRPRLPVIELLHGSPGSPADWTRGGRADVTADAYARAHHGFAPVLVMPDVNGKGWMRDSECVNGPQGNAETYLTVDVRRAVVAAFGTRSDGASWAVAGLSEGGSCALQMGLRHPDLFSFVGDFSGDDHPWISGGLRRLFRGRTINQLEQAERAYDPRVLLAGWHAGRAPAIVFTSGRGDHVLPRMQRLFLEARRAHIDASLEVFPGGHTFWLWSRSFAETMPSIVARIERAGLRAGPERGPIRLARGAVRPVARGIGVVR